MRNSKKNALLVSFIAILLCTAMLIGTTFAWFTDTASTGVNKIVAGNLDIVLEYLDNGTWKEVDTQKNLFQTDLWEPGTTDVVYLRVKNVGTLAVNYKYGVNVITETIGKNVVDSSEIKLSEILKFGVVTGDDEVTYDNRILLQNAIANSTLNLNTFTNSIMLLPNQVKYHTVVVHMPQEIGNEANHITGTTAPSIDMGIDFVATQAPYEEDSFGNNYDVPAILGSGYTVSIKQPVEIITNGLNTNLVTVDNSGVLETTETVRGTQSVTAGGITVTYASEIATVTKNETPIAGMYPNVNEAIISGAVTSGNETILEDTASGTKATIPANAVEKGILKEGQKIHLVIVTTYNNNNAATYDISLRDSNGKAFSWNSECMPEVTFKLGTSKELIGVENFNLFEQGWANIRDGKGAQLYPEETYGNTIYNGTGSDYGFLKYGDEYSPGMTYDPVSGFVTIRSLTFE